MQPSVIIKNLSVTLGGKIQALQNVTIELQAAKITGIIGPSGAGKTTLIRSIVGRLVIPEKNTVLVFGLPAGSPELREALTYMTQGLSVYPDLTVHENMVYFAKMHGMSQGQIRESISQILKQVDLTDKENALVENLSGGQKQRVSLAVALIGSPKIMVLDEPTVGLDPVLRDNLWKLFKQLADSGVTLIISSHSMDEASRCDDLVLLRDGRVISQASPKKLLEKTKTHSVEAAFLKLAGDTQ